MPLVKIYSARDSLEAHHLRGLLEAKGIAATVFGETLSVARGGLPMTQETLPSVWVKAEDSDRAMQAVRRFVDTSGGDNQASRQGDSWRCAQCGEKVEAQFTACWRCGTARGDAETD